MCHSIGKNGNSLDNLEFHAVFITIALLTLCAIAILSLRDWACRPRLSARAIKKDLTKISQFIALRDWKRAEKELAPILESGKGGKEADLFEIQILRETGKIGEALNRVLSKSRLYPEELLFRLEEAIILLSLKKPRESLKAFTACESLLRGESDLFSFASALYQTDHFQRAYDILKPLLSNTSNDQILTLAGDALYSLKCFQEAIGLYTHAIRRGSQSHHIFTQLGHAYRRLGNLYEAEKIFRSLLEKDARDLEAILGIGACLQERGEYHKAFILYQSGLQWSQNLELLYKAAYVALRAKKYQYAMSYFQELISQKGPTPQTLAYYGLALECQKKWGEAEQIYLQFIQLFPNHLQGYRALAWMFGVGLSLTLSPQEGIGFALHALNLKNDPFSWEILSACEARNGNFERAYQIQLSLAKQDQDSQARSRRQQALRTLRKKMPLHDHHVLHFILPLSPENCYLQLNQV